MMLTISTAEGPRQASVFVGLPAVLGYLYAEATWTQTAEDWLASHVRMFSHLDGVAAGARQSQDRITHASFYDPVVNRSYHELARHYGTGVVPTRCVQETKPAPKRASRLSKPGCWQRCAIACSSRWTRPTRRSGNWSPQSTRGR